MNRMQERYQKEVMPALLKAFQYKNVMQVPHIEKVVVNIGLGSEQENAKSLEAAMGDLTIITGQKPVMTKDVGLPRPVVECCSPARARLPRRLSGCFRRAGQLYAWSA